MVIAGILHEAKLFAMACCRGAAAMLHGVRQREADKNVEITCSQPKNHENLRSIWGYVLEPDGLEPEGNLRKLDVPDSEYGAASASPHIVPKSSMA